MRLMTVIGPLICMAAVLGSGGVLARAPSKCDFRYHRQKVVIADTPEDRYQARIAAAHSNFESAKQLCNRSSDQNKDACLREAEMGEDRARVWADEQLEAELAKQQSH